MSLFLEFCARAVAKPRAIWTSWTSWSFQQQKLLAQAFVAFCSKRSSLGMIGIACFPFGLASRCFWTIMASPNPWTSWLLVQFVWQYSTVLTVGSSETIRDPYGYGSIPIHTIFRGMNIHLPAILMFTRGIGSWPIPISQDGCRWCRHFEMHSSLDRFDSRHLCERAGPKDFGVRSCGMGCLVMLRCWCNLMNRPCFIEHIECYSLRCTYLCLLDLYTAVNSKT